MGDYTYLKLVFDEEVHSTDMATLLQFGDKQVWVPESLTQYIDEDSHEVWIADWFVDKEGLEAFIDED